MDTRKNISITRGILYTFGILFCLFAAYAFLTYRAMHIQLLISWGLITAGIMFFTIRKTRAMERQASAEKSWLTVMLNSIGDGVLATDHTGKIILINSVAEHLTGWREKEAIGEDASDIFNIIHEQTREPYENPVQMVLATNQVVNLARNYSA